MVLYCSVYLESSLMTSIGWLECLASARASPTVCCWYLILISVDMILTFLWQFRGHFATIILLTSALTATLCVFMWSRIVSLILYLAEQNLHLYGYQSKWSSLLIWISNSNFVRFTTSQSAHANIMSTKCCQIVAAITVIGYCAEMKCVSNSIAAEWYWRAGADWLFLSMQIHVNMLFVLCMHISYQISN